MESRGGGGGFQNKTPLWLKLKMCFIFTPRSFFVRVGVSLDGNPSYCDISKLMWRTARPDKGIFLLFMPPLRHFNLKMLNILISVFFFRAGHRFASYIMLHFFPPPLHRGQRNKPKNGARWGRVPRHPRLHQTSAGSLSGNEAEVSEGLNWCKEKDPNQLESAAVWLLKVWAKMHHDREHIQVSKMAFNHNRLG